MPEPTTANADGGQAPTSVTPQAGTPTIDGQAPVSQTQPTEHERIIAELRKEQAANRTKLKAYEEAQQAAEMAKLGDLEKATKQAEQLQKQVQQLRDENVKAQIRLQAKTLGIANDELISPYVLSKLEFDDDGKPTNLDKVLDEVIKANPNLVVQANSAAQTANAKQAPTTPANNPGRSSIVQPGTLQPGKVTTWNDVYNKQR